MVLAWRVAEILFLAVAVIAAMAAVMLSKEGGPAALLALTIAVASSIGVYLLHKRIQKLTEPKPITIPADFRGPIRIFRGKKRLLVFSFVALLFLAMALFDYEHENYFRASFFGFFGGLILIAFMSDLRQLGNPYLVLDGQGMTTYEYGRIPWSEVDNVLLQVIQNRGSKHYLLGISVYEAEKYFRRMGVLQRLFKMKWLELPSERDRLRISLGLLSHDPLYIDAVVKHFRAQYARSIGVTPKTGDLSVDRKFTEVDKLMGSLKHDDDSAKIRSTMRKIDGLIGEVKQETRDYYQRGQKDTVIVVVVGLVFAILFVVTKLLGK